MTRKQKRLAFIGAGLAMLGLASVIMLNALSASMVYYRVPDDIATGAVKPGERFRLGGMVRPGSVERGEGALVRFVVADTKSAVAVRYVGLLPDLFSEGQIAVAEGRLTSEGVFMADTVLAKHDENYMPREVADALAKQAAEARAGKESSKGADMP